MVGKHDGSDVKVELRNESGRAALGRARVVALAREAIRGGGRKRGGYEVSLLFTHDRVMRRLNRRYLGRDRTTDVIAWPEEPGSRGPALGDIAISVPRAAGQAAAYGWGLRRELELLVVHGMLHLLGFDHEADEGEMEALQDKILEEIRG